MLEQFGQSPACYTWLYFLSLTALQCCFTLNHKTFWWPSEPRARTAWAKKKSLMVLAQSGLAQSGSTCCSEPKWSAATYDEVRHLEPGTDKVYHIGDSKSAQELVVLLRMSRERLRLGCGIQCIDNIHPLGLESSLCGLAVLHYIELENIWVDSEVGFCMLFLFACTLWFVFHRTLRPALFNSFVILNVIGASFSLIECASCHRYLEPNGFSASILLFRAPLMTRLRNGSLVSDALFREGFLMFLNLFD